MARPSCKMWSLEKKYHQQKVYRLAGVDEVGRGCLSGPVVAAAFMAKPGTKLPPVKDSKQLTANQRKKLYPVVIDSALAYAIGIASPRDVDELNVLESTRLAMARALRALPVKPELALIDGMDLDIRNLATKKIIRGDARVGSIAAASIIAKVTRDTLMQNLHRLYPEYGWVRNKGYGTPEHLDALRRLGPCPHHRVSFNCVRQPKLML